MNTIIIDFETRLDSKNGLTLKKQSITEYIHDSRFAVLGCGVQIGDEEPFWLTGEKLEEEFGIWPWHEYTVVAHNASFDLAILHWKYGILPKQMVCTKSMARAVYGASIPSFSLKALAEKLGFPEKGELDIDGKETLTEEEQKALEEYCLRDVELSASLFRRLYDQIPACEWPIIDWTIRAFVDPKLKLNKPLAKQIEREVQASQDRIIAATGITKDTFSSNKKYAEFLTELGYKVPTKINKSGKEIPAFSRADKAFVEFVENGDERLKALHQARLAAKQTNERTRAKSISELPTDLYPVDIQYSGALQTHRFSGGNGSSGNFQNFKNDSEIKRCIEAPEGYTLIEADFSRVEPRILAAASRDPRLNIDLKKTDPYIAFASEVYKRPITKEDEVERKVGKAAILGLGYNMGAERFIQTAKTSAGIVIDRKESWEIVSFYRKHYPYVPLFWKTCGLVIEMMAKGQAGPFPTFPLLKIKKEALVLPSGLELKYPNLRQQAGEKGPEWVYTKYKSQKTAVDNIRIYGGLLTENICQSLAGEACKEAIRRLLKTKYHVVGQVHDSILVLCKTEELEEAKQAIRVAMTDKLPWWPQLTLDVSMKHGANWRFK